MSILSECADATVRELSLLPSLMKKNLLSLWKGILIVVKLLFNDFFNGVVIILLFLLNWYKALETTTINGCTVEAGTAINPFLTDLCGSRIVENDKLFIATFVIYLFSYCFGFLMKLFHIETINFTYRTTVGTDMDITLGYTSYTVLTTTICELIFIVYLPEGIDNEKFNTIYGARIAIIVWFAVHMLEYLMVLLKMIIKN
jgi:hypothetical protein